MKKSMLLFASITLAGSLLAACGNQEAEEPKEETVQEEAADQEENAQSEEVALEETATAKQVAAYKAIMDELNKMKEDKEVDWSVVKSTYQNELKAETGDFDNLITAGINAGKDGEGDQNVARQLIDKGIQSYFYSKQKSLHGEAGDALAAGDQAKAEAAFAELKHLVEEVIIPTAEKRDGYYELTGEDSMVENINNGLSLQEEALAAGNADDFSVYKQMTDKSVYRSYYLAANSYAEKIAAAVNEGNADEAELKIMQAEAYGFYQAIKGSLSGGDEEAANKLDELFNAAVTDAKTLNAEEVSDLFLKAFIGKITGYHEKVAAALEAGEAAEARVEAMEANVFTKDIELALAKKLGEEQTAELLDHAAKWYEAVANENAEEAASHSEAIVPVLKGVVQ
ncbi:hypothetical protein [Bacillus taeanensis]|uniref:Lipoprotein n=1 Tax=Bacillus taeanensis TaxID=273032 RepID=A0A366Y580_9BACI|nr:hypothetical protein [Bacillus taeanensis]RBW71534.1 hypothetical protein DS031_01940 [Bacillus taeanensis]